MLTQSGIRDQYQLDANGCVANPGKFEGEHWTTVAFWSLVVEDGDSGDDELQWGEDCVENLFVLDDELRADCGIDATEYAFSVYSDSQGFVSGQTIDKATYDARVAEYEANAALYDA